jgi:uncharacterized membrane protein
MSVEQSTTRAPAQHRPRTLGLRESYDLLLLVVAALLLPGLLFMPLLLLRVPVALALVLFAPGYALTAALFIGADDLDRITRVALSFGLSVAVLPVLALILNALPWGIGPLSIALSLSVWILLCCCIALVRRLLLAPVHGLYIPPNLSLPSRGRLLGSPGGRTVAIGLTVAGVLVGLLLVVFTAGRAMQQTEFYMLGKSGLAEDFPRETRPGEALAVTIGIANRDMETHTYRVEVRAAQLGNGAAGELLQAVGPITLAPNQTQELPVSWRMSKIADDQQVLFLLFADNNLAPYRRLELWLNVVEPGAA